MTLSQEAQADLNCWVHNVTLAFRNILPTDPDLTLTIDALTQAGGWGAVQGAQQLVVYVNAMRGYIDLGHPKSGAPVDRLG